MSGYTVSGVEYGEIFCVGTNCTVVEVYVVNNISASNWFVFPTAPPALLPNGIMGMGYGSVMMNMYGSTSNSYPASIFLKNGFNFINSDNSVIALGWNGTAPSSVSTTQSIALTTTNSKTVPI